MVRLRNKYSFYLLLILIMGLGLWLRLRNIDQRPMHGDEANQAYRFEMLFESGDFKYEPKDFHGPTLYYLTLPSAWISGLDKYENSTKSTYRGVTVFFSLLLVFGSLLFIDILGRKGVLFMSLFLMVSPAMVYYSTYYIQETLLVCFTLFFIGSLWRLWRKPGIVWAISAGVFLGLMHATKETFVIAVFSLACSIAYLSWKSGKFDFKRLDPKHYVSFLMSAIVTSVIFFSSFFTNPSGPVDSISSFVYQVKRGLGSSDFEERFTSGEGHSKSPTYYLSTLIGHYPRKFTSTVKDVYRNSPARPITEIFFLLFPVVGFLNLPAKGSRSRKFFVAAAVYTFVMLGVYSFIPYKTPWCLLSFLCGFMFLCALSVRYMSSNFARPVNKVLALLAVLMIFDLGRQSALVNAEEFCVTDKNPYAYVQPFYDVEDMSTRIEEISKVEGSGYEMPVHFLTPEYWPLPFYLKKFKNVGYWENEIPQLDLKQLPVIITTPDREELVKGLEESHFPEFRGRMPGYHLLVFYRKDLWERYNERR